MSPSQKPVDDRVKNLSSIKTDPLNSGMSQIDGIDHIWGCVEKKISFNDGSTNTFHYMFRSGLPDFRGNLNVPKPLPKVTDILSGMEEWKGKEDTEEFKTLAKQLENIPIS